MKTIIKKKQAFSDQDNLILFCDKKSKLSSFDLSRSELTFIKKQWSDKKEIVAINQYTRLIFVVNPKQEKDTNKHFESLRLLGDQLQGSLKDEAAVMIIDVKGNQKNFLQLQREWRFLIILLPNIKQILKHIN